MSKSLKLFLGISYVLILFIFLFLIFNNIEVGRLNDFSYYKDLQTSLEKTISDRLYINLFIFFFICLIWVILLGFGFPLLIISGILFGKWVGTLISLISISVGALILYVIANFFFKELIENLLEKKFSKYIHLFRKNEFNYFFAFRICGGFGIPFGLQNILPVIFNIRKTNYFYASLLGFVPSFFIINTIGSGLNQYVKQADNFSIISLLLNSEIYLPMIFFIIIMFLTLLIKKKIFGKIE